MKPERAGPRLPPDTLDTTRQVLEAVRVGGCRSRPAIVAHSGLGRAIVAQRAVELLSTGLLAEAGTGESTGGRPPKQVSFRAEAGYVLAADLGATSIDVAVADLGGSILAHSMETADIAAGPAVILPRLEAMFADALRGQADGTPVFGIGVGVPGPVEFDRGRPAAPPIMPGWDDYPVRDDIEARLGSPVWVDNDVNLMALGEWRAGVARGHDNVVFLKVGTGIGAGLISDGQLHRGSQGCAGDIGHMHVTSDPILCRCGNTGCLEAIAGGAALARDAMALAASGRSSMLAGIVAERGEATARDVSFAASRGDGECAALLEESARYVGRTLAAVVNLFNPSLIVIGGGIAATGDRYLATIRQTVYQRSLPLATRSLQILPSGLGPLAGVLGAAAMVVDELFSPEQLAGTLARSAAQGPAPVMPRDV